MNANTLRALEFDRIVEAVADLAVTPTGHEQLAKLRPLKDPAAVAFAQKATIDGVRFLVDHPGFPLRAPSDLEAIIDALGVEGRPLEAARLVALADYLESIEHSRAAVRNATAMYPILRERPPTTGARRWRASASGCGVNAPSCGPRWNRSCGGATRRNTCRSRSSPIATAATCWSCAPSTGPRFPASS